MTRLLLVAAAALAVGGPAVAETPKASPGARATTPKPAPATGRPLAAPPPAAAPSGAAEFRRLALASDAFEIEASRLALQRSRNPAVRRFAQAMMRDHAASAAAMGGVTAPAPAGPLGALVAGPAAAPATAAPGLDARHAAMLKQLASLKGRAFDRAYARMQLAAHQEAVALYTAFAQGGPDPSLRGIAAETLPTLQHHLGMAQRLLGRRG